MDIFDEYTEIGDVVEVIVNGSPWTTVEAFVLAFYEKENDRWKVQLGLTETNQDYTVVMQRGMNYHITIGESDQEVTKLLKTRTNIKELVGIKTGSKTDALAKYEAFLDVTIAGLVESTSTGLRTRNSFFKRKI